MQAELFQMAAEQHGAAHQGLLANWSDMISEIIESAAAESEAVVDAQRPIASAQCLQHGMRSNQPGSLAVVTGINSSIVEAMWRSDCSVS